MSQRNRTIEWGVWGGLSLIILAIAVLFVVRPPQESPAATPIPWPQSMSQLHVPDFHLTNQFSKEISLADLKGQVWVADIIFTRCPGICPQMSKHLTELQNALPAELPVRFISLTSDATNDTPAVLKEYADRYGADGKRWWFLTGAKADVNRLAVDGLKLTAQEVDPKERQSPEDLFIHSSIFVLVDRQGRIRGTIESIDELGWKERTRKAIEQLVRETP